MPSSHRPRETKTALPRSTRALLALAALAALGPTGCASPGPPRSPSLNLPGPVNDLTATRTGAAVTLRFTLPQRSTDHLPLRAPTLSATVCRSLDTAACLPIAALSARSFARVTNGRATVATLSDTLPPALTTGAPRLIAYRVELFNPSNRTAGFSGPTFAAAGTAPSTVEGLAAQGSRLGIVLTWHPAPPDGSEVVLRREDLAPKPPPAPKSPTAKSSTHGKSSPPSATRINRDDESNTVWLSTTPPSGKPSSTGIVLDATALPDEPYRYTAERRRPVQLDGHTLELRSDPSPGVQYTLHDIYPPPPPTDLTAAAYRTAGPASSLAVDLIWQPVDDPRLAGYNIYRQPLDATGTPTAPNKRLNSIPIPLPAFHDTIPAPAAGNRYRYSVTSIDAKGNEGAACTATLDPNQP